MKDMLADAAKNGYAVGGFNCASLESAMGAIKASEELGIPFVLQHAGAHEEFIPLSVAGPIMIQLARAAKTPVAVHLDHGDSIETCLKALAMGFTSVMFDRGVGGVFGDKGFGERESECFCDAFAVGRISAVAVANMALLDKHLRIAHRTCRILASSLLVFGSH